jgi:hypothetical protein
LKSADKANNKLLENKTALHSRVHKKIVQSMDGAKDVARQQTPATSIPLQGKLKAAHPLFTFPWANTILEIPALKTSTYAYKFHWGIEGKGDGEFALPRAIVVDDRERFYVSDSQNHRVQMFEADGKYLRSFGKDGKSLPVSIPIEPRRCLCPSIWKVLCTSACQMMGTYFFPWHLDLYVFDLNNFRLKVKRKENSDFPQA